MRILCPHCGRAGNLPADLRIGAHAVRCRRCDSRFAAVSYVSPGALPPTDELRFLAPTLNPRTVGDFGRFSTDPLGDGSAEYDSCEFLLGPGDSQYELPSFADGFDDDEPPVGLPAITSPQPEPSTIQAANVREALRRGSGERRAESVQEPKQVQAMHYGNGLRVGNGERAAENGHEPKQSPPARLSEALAAKPIAIVAWNSRFIEIWSRCQLVATLAFGALSFGILGYLLWKSAIGGQGHAPTASALVLGFLGTAAFVFLSLTALARNVLLTQISRELRRLNELN
jgi:hypothetical protein